MQSAFIDVKPATAAGVIAASVPPANIISTSPFWIAKKASPMQFVPLAQAVTIHSEGPWIPNAMAICPAAIFAITIGIKNGLILEGPFSKSFLYWSCKVCIPPIPLPTKTPARSRFIVSRLSFESSNASFAAANANCVYLSIRLDSFLSIKSSGVKSLISPPILQRCSLVSNCSIKLIPFLPFFKLSKNFSLPIPIGVTGPIPVMTTRFFN